MVFQSQSGFAVYRDGALMHLLTHRFGDGLVYLDSPSERPVFRMAIARGLVSREGYLTPAGRDWLAQHHAY